MGINGQKIAVLCDYRLLPERVGGMDHFFWRFDAACKKQGILVTWFFPNAATHGKYQELNIIPAEGKSMESAFLGYFQAKNHRFSHIITHFLELCTPFFKTLKEQTDAKVIAVDHNPRPLGGYSFKKRIKKRLKGAVFGRYIDLFVGVSNYTVNELVKDFGSQIKPKSRVIYNGIVVENIKTRTDSHQPPRFVMVSHLRKSKGIQDLIAAVSLLPEKIKYELKIDVYGEGPFENELKTLINDQKLAKNFRFLGSSDRISSIFCGYDYLLHPTHMECFSLTILESLAANVPVITTPVGGNTEVVQNGVNGFIVPVQQPAQLAKIMEELWNGEKTIKADTRSTIAEAFSIEKMTREHIKLLC